MAQLRLAERLVAEKDQDLRVVEYRADQALLEKEALAEELVHMKSVRTLSASSVNEVSTPSPGTHRVGGSDHVIWVYCHVTRKW